MLRHSERLEELERRYAQEAFEGWTYGDALRLYEALWAEAVALHSEIGADWREDLEPDLAVARALNGLPPTR